MTEKDFYRLSRSEPVEIIPQLQDNENTDAGKLNSLPAIDIIAIKNIRWKIYEKIFKYTT